MLRASDMVGEFDLRAYEGVAGALCEGRGVLDRNVASPQCRPPVSAKKTLKFRESRCKWDHLPSLELALGTFAPTAACTRCVYAEAVCVCPMQWPMYGVGLPLL